VTGPQHYREAGRLLALAARTRDSTYTQEDLAHAAQMTAEAGVHATLALAAVTAEADQRGCAGTWHEAGAW
jgi:hypothetical protein